MKDYFRLLLRYPKVFVKKVLNRFITAFKIYVLRDEFELEYRRWIDDEGDDKLRFEYPNLNENSIVFDVGGYVGDFAERIHEKYGCYVFLFEPHPAFYETCLKRFTENEKIIPLNYGLGNKEGIFDLSDSVDGSSFSKHQHEEKDFIKCRSAEFFSVLEELDISHIDLMKINIEGGEYQLLQHILQNDKATLVSEYQTQFHKLNNDSKALRTNIQEQLSKSHKLTWHYYFIWENWKKN
jgi:FkbM family methyltransferase